ncbi:MAG: NLP/P60 protein [Parcubacteria group bacterium LiPW_41]|nr:MAG: NLP/P60 protein [Parcubacteria group bacterium LiPW_41]
MTEQQKLQIIEIAKKQIGKPYVFGAHEAEEGEVFDCSSFVQFVFSSIGIDLPRSSILQAGDEKGKEITLGSELEVGDLLFMRGVRGYYRDSFFGGRELYIGHVGIYLGNNKIIHAQAHKEPHGVIVETIEELEKEKNYKINLVKRF